MRHTLGLFCVLLLCSQVFADLTWPVQKSGTLSAGNPLNGTFRTNLKAGATLLVEHTRPVRVCLQRFVQLPDISQWSSACTWYKEFGHPTLRRSVISLGEALAVNDSAPFTANNDLYNWGVQLQNTSFNDSATVMLSGDTCPEGQAFNGTDCTAVQPLAGAPAKPLLNVGDIVFYSFYVGYGVKSISVAATTSDGKATFNSYLRLNGVPSSFVNDTSGAATVSKGFPQPGLWYYALHLATAEDDFAATEVTVTLTVDVCAAGSFGTNCNTTVNPTDDSSLVVANLKLDGYVYFSVTPSATTPLYVSFQSSKLAVGISVYGSIGNLPSPDNYLIKGCNQQYCHSVTSIKLDNSTNTLYGNETWIFGITTADNDTDVGAWINSVCAPTCDSPSGECIADGPDAGLCTCEDSYIGIDCTIPVGLPSQYIVLIIIAALVIASAVIGFIAWAYMRRRRRVHYEKVV